MHAQWFQRIEAERRAGNLTRAERDALRALGRLMAMGDDMPSEARVANEGGVSKRTVARAKARARTLGLLQWERRFAGRALRRELPCAYRAEMPTREVVRRERQRGSLKPESNIRRSVQQQLAALPPITPELQALWKARLSSAPAAGRHAFASSPQASPRPQPVSSRAAELWRSGTPHTRYR